MNNPIHKTIVRDIASSAKWGLITLFLANGCAAFTGISLGFSWLSGGTAIALGPSGIIGLFLLNALFLSV